MSNYWVYMLECADKTFYTGIAKNPPTRLDKHNSGEGAKYTRIRRPVRFIYLEESTDRSEASKREYAIKQLTRQEKKHLIRSNKNQFIGRKI